jgi:hypothetical protein
MSSVYNLHPLKCDTHTNIRLIELHYDNDADSAAPISCSLMVVSFEYEPSYTALSYVWGDKSVTKTILLDGKPFAVRENLWNFLVQYRAKKEEGLLWIDALCIDQDSIIERNHQVALMGRIYRNAELVIAWLGLGCEQAIKTLTEVTDLNRAEPNNAHYDIRRNAYWTRLWIVQEFVLCWNTEVWSGAARVEGDGLVSLFGVEFEEEDLDFFPREGVGDAFEAILGCRKAYGENRVKASTLSSRNLFTIFRYAKCSDVRDRVYGLLGLINSQESKEFPIQPDYSKSPSELFAEVWTRHEQQIGQPVESRTWWEFKWYAESLQRQLALDDSDENISRLFEKFESVRVMLGISPPKPPSDDPSSAY